MAKQKKLIALKPFPFRGVELAVDEEFEPDNEEQSKLLITIGHAAVPKRKPYLNRVARPTVTAVMTTNTES